MLIRDVHPVVLEAINRQQSVIMIEHSIGAYTIPIARILSMVKNYLVIDNSDCYFPISDVGSNKANWIIGAIIRVEPAGNAFAATCYMPDDELQRILSEKQDMKPSSYGIRQTRDMISAIKLASVEVMNRMNAAKQASLYSSLNLFPPNFRKQFGQMQPDYGKQFNGPFATQPPIPHHAPLNTMWQVAFQQQQPSTQSPTSDQFSKPASFGPGGLRTQSNPTQQSQSAPFDPTKDDVETIEVEAIPIRPQSSRPSANHISGMINAILASGNTHGVVASKPNDTVGAFVNGDGNLIITYDDGSISPPIKPESLSIDPYDIDEVTIQDMRDITPIQAIRKVPFGQPMGVEIDED